MKHIRDHLMKGAAVLALSAFQAMPVAAQTAPAAEPVTADTADIVVTANKREERLLDVAASVSALRGDALAARRLLQVEDFAAQVPGLSVQPSSNRANRIILRGLNAGGQGATVASIIDEAPLSYSSGTGPGAINIANIDTYDLARVEVLRGPQGTLYGAAAEGGLVKYVTNAPRLDAIEGGAEGTIESVKGGEIGYTGRGFINLPLGDKLALRATGFYQHIAGYIDAPRRNRQDANDGRRYGGRVQLLFKPSEDLSFRLTALRQDQRFNDDGLINVVGAALFPTVPAPANQLDSVTSGRFVRNNFTAGVSENRTELYSLVANWTPGSVDILSATSFGRVNSDFVADASNTQSPALPPGVNFSQALGLFVYGQPVDLRVRQTNNLKKFNQELRIATRPGSTVAGLAVDLQGGVYYTREETTFDQFYDVLRAGTGTLITTPGGGASTLPATYDEISVFGNAKVHFTPGFSVEVGARNAWNWQDFQVSTSPGVVTGPVGVVNPTRKSNESKLTWSVAPQFKLGETAQIYGRVATGYRPGGPKPVVPNPINPVTPSYKSDTTTNYEVGFKGQLFDKILTVDVAVFQIDWKDIQISTLVPTATTPFRVPDNAGTARSRGVEWSFALVPARGLTLGVVGAYVDAKLTRDAPGLGAFNGDRLPYVPDWTNTVNLDYRFTLGEGTVSVGGSWNHIGERRSNFTGDGITIGLVRLPKYDTFSAQLGIELRNIRAELFMRNIGNKYAVLDYTSNSGSGLTGSAQILQPFTAGATIGFKF